MWLIEIRMRAYKKNTNLIIIILNVIDRNKNVCLWKKKYEPNKKITLNVIDSNKNACLWKKNTNLLIIILNVIDRNKNVCLWKKYELNNNNIECDW